MIVPSAGIPATVLSDVDFKLRAHSVLGQLGKIVTSVALRRIHRSRRWPRRTISACWLLPLSRPVECNTASHQLMLLRAMGRRSLLPILWSHNGFLNVGCGYAA